VQQKDELGFGSVGVADAADAWSSGRMPAFQTEPEPPVQPTGEEAPAPTAAIAAPNPAEVQWGFDDAQIETASRGVAASPPAGRVPAGEPAPTRVRATQTQTQTRRTPPQFTQPQQKRG